MNKERFFRILRMLLLTALCSAFIFYKSPDFQNQCKKEIFSCEKHWEEAERFYREEGEWKGVFQMSVLNSVLSRGTVCHIKYLYSPVPGSYRLDSGIDYRFFVFVQDPKKCHWKVQDMGGYQSGFLAK